MAYYLRVTRDGKKEEVTVEAEDCQLEYIFSL